MDSASGSAREGVSSEAGVPGPGQVIAHKYEVERVLGEGGMGVVLAARHLELGQRVAIKLMRAEVAQDASAAERFLREARASVALGSPHVTRVLDVGRLDSGAPYMVMEYLAGQDLSRVLARNGPLAVQSAVGLVLQACDAIAEAHSVGIVHRDLKPANLFVTTARDGAPLVKVLDFGISKAGPSEGAAAQSLTASGVVMGSPAYMSPEQVRSSRDVDARSDIWSLGVILYELLTGVSPFLGESMGDTFARIVSERPKGIRDIRPEVPSGLAKTIDACLERRVEARTGSVAVLASKLAEYAAPDAAALVASIHRISRPSPDAPSPRTLLAPETISGSTRRAPTEGPLDTGPAWLRSANGAPRPRARPTVVAIFAGAALVLTAGAGALWIRGRSPTPAPHASVAPPSISAIPPSTTAPTLSATAADPATAPPIAPPNEVLPPRNDTMASPALAEPVEPQAAADAGHHAANHGIPGHPQSRSHDASGAASSSAQRPNNKGPGTANEPDLL